MQVQGLSMIFSRKEEGDPATFSVAVFFYEANATDPSLPGNVLPGWEGGLAVTVAKGSTVSPTGGTVTAPFYRVTGAITPSFNLSAGTYFLSVASFGSKPSTTDGAYRIAGSNTTGTYFATYLGIKPRGTIYPAFNANATDAWTVLTGATNVLACVWCAHGPVHSFTCLFVYLLIVVVVFVISFLGRLLTHGGIRRPTGTVHRPQNTTTNTTTTTTTGNTTTTAGTTTTTTTGNTTTTGGSGGAALPSLPSPCLCDLSVSAA
jgi:hypothetical protein